MAKRKKIIKIEEKKEDNYEKQIKIAVLIMVAIVAFTLFFYIVSYEMRKFNYAGIKVEKGKLGEDIFYLAKFPVINEFGETINYLDVYMREDPRRLTNIILPEDIKLKQKVAISTESDFIKNCAHSITAAATLSQFLGKSGLNVFSATGNKTESEIYDLPYVSCQNTTQYSIITYQKGNETKIEKLGDCYILTAGNNCEVMNVTERFIFGIYADARGIEI